MEKSAGGLRGGIASSAASAAIVITAIVADIAIRKLAISSQRSPR